MVNLKDELTLDASLLLGIKEPFIDSSKTLRHNRIAYRLPICPYVSSTFVDLEEEFKHLHANVFPRLNALCSERGSYFLPLDFRRSAVDNRSSSDMILKNALNNVWSALPFFICVIGSNYGSHRLPNSDLLSPSVAATTASKSALSLMDSNLLTASTEYPWVLEKDFHCCSMMNLEVILACFLNESHFPKHCYFYIKECCVENAQQENIETLLESESEYAQAQLAELKLQIINKGLPVKFFVTKEELGDALLKDWSEVIMSYLSPFSLHHIHGDQLFLQSQLQESLIFRSVSKYLRFEDLIHLEGDLLLHTLAIGPYLSNRKLNFGGELTDEDLYTKDAISLSGFKVGDGIFSTTASFLKTLKHDNNVDETSLNNNSILAVVGGIGSGKTVFLTNWMLEFRKEYPEFLILSEFVGVSQFSYDPANFLRRCIRTIREKYFQVKSTGRDLVSYVESYKGLVEAFACALQLLPCIIVIDSIDNFATTMGEDIGSIKGLTWLPKSLPPWCKIIVTTRSSDLSCKVLQARSDVTMAWMPTIDLSVKRAILENHLNKNGREAFYLVAMKTKFSEIKVLSSIEYETREKIWNNKLSERPLYLSTLGNILNACRTDRERCQAVEMCTAPRNFRDFWRSVFVLWTHRYSWSKTSPGQPGSVRGRNTASGWVIDALKVIASSRQGLHRSEIIHLLFLIGYRGRATVTPNDWDMFYVATGGLLVTGGNGLIRIAHVSMHRAICHFLFVTGRSSSRFGGGFLEHKQQRHHLLLFNFFFKHGSMERKLVELPWQAQQGRDWLMLHQVLVQPRFFLAMCEESQWNPTLYTDHVTYWRQLAEHDFDTYHCLKAMFEPTLHGIDEDSAHESGDEKSVRLSISDRVVKTHLPRGVSKPPAIIVVTQHDEVSVHKSTEDSRSETEDRDYMSECESTSFFLTEGEVDYHLLVAGWRPAEDSPESCVDDSPLSDEESVCLRQKIAWFLFQLGHKYQSIAVEVTESMLIHLENSRPLSFALQLCYFELVAVARKNSCCKNAILLDRAMQIFDNLSLKAMSLSYTKRRYIADQAAELRLHLASHLTNEKRLQEARLLALRVFEDNKKWKSMFCQVQATRMFGKLLMRLGLFSQSEEMLTNAFATCLKWNGKVHLDIAEILQDLASLYSTLLSVDRANRRKAMLAYKQALEIYQFNQKPLKAAKVFSMIGQLLDEEGSLRSKREALSCFEQSLDVYMTNNYEDREKIATVTNQCKRVLSDLSSGRFVHGSAKSKDRRTPERPYSSLTWHSHELNKMVENEETSKPELADDANSHRTLKQNTTIHRPYSAYTSTSVGNRVLVTSRKLNLQVNNEKNPKRPATTPSTSRSTPKVIACLKSEYTGANASTRVKSADPLETLTPISPVNQRPGTSEEKEHPVVFVPGEINKDGVLQETGRFDLKQGTHVSGLVSENTARSEISTIKRSVRLHEHPEVITQARSPLKHRCDHVAGPDRLLLTVHGPHSTIDDMHYTPPSSRGSSRSVDVFHKSAWFHVPGRYPKPGQVLPSKRSQRHSIGQKSKFTPKRDQDQTKKKKRPVSAATQSMRSNRSHPVSRSHSRQGYDNSIKSISRRHSVPRLEKPVIITSNFPTPFALKEVMFAVK